MTSTSTGSADPADGSGAATDVGGTTPPTGRPIRPTLSPTSAVVAGLAVPGLDLRTPRAVVDARAGRRIRFRRSVLGGCAAIAVIGLAVAVFPRGEPDGVVADADATTSTSVPDTTVPADTVPVAAPTAPPTTAKAVTTTTAKPVTTLAPPTTVPPPTTAPPVEPIAVSGFTVAGTAGSNLLLTVQWTDPTPGPAPNGVRATVVWGSGVVSTPDTDVPCAPPGTPLQATNRYAATGQPLIQVEISRCNGTGESAQLKVNPNVAGPKDGYVVVVGGATGHSPDAATVGAGAATIAARTPELGQTDASNKPVTVLTVPSGYSGPLVFRWPDGWCQQTPNVSPSTPLQPTVVLDQTACAATTGSTVP